MVTLVRLICADLFWWPFCIINVGVPLFSWNTRAEGDTFTCKHMLPVQKAIYSLLVGSKGKRAESSYRTSLTLLAPCPEKVCVIKGLQILMRIEAIYVPYLLTGPGSSWGCGP